MTPTLLCRQGLLRATLHRARRTTRCVCALAAPERDSRLAANQLRTAAALLESLAPHVNSDAYLPSRVKELCGERRFNSSSRRLYRELLYTYLRFWPWFSSLQSSAAADCAALLAPATPEVTRLRQAGVLPPLLQGASTLEDARLELQALAGQELCSAAELATPSWLHGALSGPAVPPELACTRPPLFIRVYKRHLLPAIQADADALGVRLLETAVRDAFKAVPDTPGLTFDLTATDSFTRDGAFEVQDLGSQMLLEAVAPVAGTRWLDACAGAGGKSLQLAALLGPDGAVRAEDVRPAALEQLALRAVRCGLSHRITRAPSPKATPPAKPLYDAVLVDAPCTGSGTWRRSPHLRWQLTPERVQAAAAMQLHLLTTHAPRVAPGGLLVYATCSQAVAENEAVVAAFLEHAGEDFEPAELPGVSTVGGVAHEHGAHLMVVSPQQHNTDAFFVAALRRRR